MKRLAIVWLALVVSTSLWAQHDETFRVIHVSGTVHHMKLSRPLQQGDKIHVSDPLKFSTRNDYVIVINPKVGRKTIRGVPDSSPRELKSLLESFLLPSEKSTGTRGLDTEYWASLNETFRDTVLILGDGTIPLNKKYMNLAKPAVVSASYKGKKGSHVSRVVNDGQSLCLSKSCLLGDADITTKVMLEYYENEADSKDLPGSGTFIGYFWPLYGDENSILKEVQVIVDVLKESPRPEIIREVRRFLADQYGQTEEQNLVAWLQAHKLISQK